MPHARNAKGAKKLKQVFTAVSENRERVNALLAGESLLVVAPFLPSPLVEKFSGEGFVSKVQHGAGGEWRVYFWRETA